MDCHSTNDNVLAVLRDRIAMGDQQAFRQLFIIFSKKLNQFAASIVKSNDGAREIVDEVFIKVWRNKENASGIQNIRVYLYAATKNTALNYLSSKARENITEPFDFFAVQLYDESQCPEKKMVTRELLRKINAAIEELPPRCKMVFKLIREDGLSYKEVGQVLNISPKTVDAQMVIAIRQISEKVRPDFDFFPNRNLRKK